MGNERAKIHAAICCQNLRRFLDLKPFFPPEINIEHLISSDDVEELSAAREFDAVIITDDFRRFVSWRTVTRCKSLNLPLIGIFNARKRIHWLRRGKGFLPHLETHVVDNCNLNCKGCSHFANLFSEEAISYPHAQFERDIERIAECFDVIRFRLMGGEPFLNPHIDAFMETARHHLPDTDIRIVTNGLLIPSLSKGVLDCIRTNDIIVNVSAYPPTVERMRPILNALDAAGVRHKVSPVKSFSAYMDPKGGSDPAHSHDYCINFLCRLLRAGKLYKCPFGALLFKFQERFPKVCCASSFDRGANIYDADITERVFQLRDPIELCRYCHFPARDFQWEGLHQPSAKDWIF